MRLFLAVTPDAAAATAIGESIERTRVALGDAASALRWTAPDNIHLTVHFLGEVDAAGLDRLTLELGRSVPMAPFAVSTGQPGVNPQAGPPRVIWTPIEDGRAPLVDLHRTIGSRVVAAGAAIEARPFAPHLTIARVRDRERRRARGLAAAVAAVRPGAARWTVDRVTLFRSDLSGPAPRYDPLHDVQLAG